MPTKFTLNLSEDQEKIIDGLKGSLNASSRSDVIRRSLSLALLYADIMKKGGSLLVADDKGVVKERICII